MYKGFTPKAKDKLAQGRKRGERTLAMHSNLESTLKGSDNWLALLFHPYRVEVSSTHYTQGALAALATLGYEL